MKKSQYKDHKGNLFLKTACQIMPYLLIALMLLPITFFSNWGPLDDWHMLDYLINNIPRAEMIYNGLSAGRFYPLYWSEWEILSKIAINPYLFYFFNFVEALIGCYILYYIAEKFTNKRTGFILILLIMFNPGLIESFYRLGVPDKNSFFLFTLGLFLFIKYLYSINSSNKINLFFLFFSIIAINVGFYFKEPGFIMVSVFSLMYMYFLIKHDKNNIKNNYYLMGTLIVLLISSILFIIIYLLNMHKVDYYYANPNFLGRIFQTFVVLIGYSLLDPLILFGGPVLLYIRIKNRNEIKFLRNDDRFYLIFADAATIGALFYALFYIVYGIITYRYLLPAYAFIIPAYAIYISIFLLKPKEQGKQIKFPSEKIRKFTMIILGLLLLNSITTGINLIMVYKYVPYNMNEFLNTAEHELKSGISEDGFNKTASIFIPGVNRGSGVEYYYSISTFLQLRGIDPNKIDMKSMDSIDSEILFNEGSKGMKYTAYQTPDVQTPASGDYLIVIPFIIYNEGELINSIKEKYDIDAQQIYRSKNTYYFQIPNAIIFGKYWVTKKGLQHSIPIFTNVGYSLYKVI